MFGFWQSKNGNFLATNQNSLGFLVFGFVLGFCQTPLPKKVHIFQVFSFSMKTPKLLLKLDISHRKFLIFKKKKKKDIFGRKNVLNE